MNDKRSIRSYVKRGNRITKSQRSALETLLPLYGLKMEEGLLDFQKTFLKKAETILEIGFGMGDSLLAMSRAFPEKNFIGIEIYRAGVGHLLMQIKQFQLDNVRIYQEDAIDVLSFCIPDNSLDAIQIFFPDPWPKKRHHKRRLIQPSFVTLLHQKLKLNGTIQLATDWENYAEHILVTLQNNRKLINLSEDNRFIPRPSSRSITKFEKKGRLLGHKVFDLLFKKIN